jgi:hypothetical protein
MTDTSQMTEQERREAIIEAENKPLQALYDMVETLVTLGASNEQLTSAIEVLCKKATERNVLRRGQNKSWSVGYKPS